MDKPQAASPRSRLQALLAIPDRQRTDAEWDEINELEIMLAPGNRHGAPTPGMRIHDRLPLMGQNKPGGNPHNHNNKKQGKKFHKRPQQQQRNNNNGNGNGGR